MSFSAFVSYGMYFKLQIASVIFDPVLLFFFCLFRCFLGVTYSACRNDLWRWL